MYDGIDGRLTAAAIKSLEIVSTSRTRETKKSNDETRAKVVKILILYSLHRAISSVQSSSLMFTEIHQSPTKASRLF